MSFLGLKSPRTFITETYKVGVTNPLCSSRLRPYYRKKILADQVHLGVKSVEKRPQETFLFNLAIGCMWDSIALSYIEVFGILLQLQPCPLQL